VKWQVVVTDTAKALLLDLSKSDQQIVFKRLKEAMELTSTILP